MRVFFLILNDMFFSMGICKNPKLKNTKPNHIEKTQNFKAAKLKGFTVYLYQTCLHKYMQAYLTKLYTHPTAINY